MGPRDVDQIGLAFHRPELARADTDVPEGVELMPFCHSKAAANILTSPKLDPFRQDPRVQVLRRARRKLRGRGGGAASLP
jgi:hypothetical protein